MRDVGTVRVHQDSRGRPTFSETLPREAQSAAVARRAVTVLLPEWGIPALVDDAALVLDEFVANAADHARGESIRVTITLRADAVVRVAVVDMGHKRPRLAEAGPGDESGRGLRLVAALSQRWGVDALGWGKRTWADLAVVAP
jgi:anti-sigma regulatory factor (Ser/Thr protein kinase)